MCVCPLRFWSPTGRIDLLLSSSVLCMSVSSLVQYSMYVFCVLRFLHGLFDYSPFDYGNDGNDSELQVSYCIFSHSLFASINHHRLLSYLLSSINYTKKTEIFNYIRIVLSLLFYKHTPNVLCLFLLKNLSPVFLILNPVSAVRSILHACIAISPVVHSCRVRHNYRNSIVISILSA